MTRRVSDPGGVDVRAVYRTGLLDVYYRDLRGRCWQVLSSEIPLATDLPRRIDAIPPGGQP